MSDHEPLDANPNGDGRAPNGQFMPGHQLSRGPRTTDAQRYRTAYARGVSEEDMEAIAVAMKAKAISGDVPAAKEVSERLMGKSIAQDLMERIEAVEALLSEQNVGARR